LYYPNLWEDQAMSDVQEVLRLLRKISDLAYDEDVGEPLDCAIDYANKAIAALAAAPAVVILPREKSDRVLSECGYGPTTPVIGGEPIAWLHQITKPDGGSFKMHSSSADNPWRPWVQKHKDKCTYTATPLYAAQPASPLRGIPTPEQIEPILDDFLGVDSPHYEELRRRCAQRIFDLCAVMSGISIKPSDNKISSGLTEDEKLARARALGQARAANKQPPTKDTSE
jgi:hypothetical protein